MLMVVELECGVNMINEILTLIVHVGMIGFTLYFVKELFSE